MNDEYAIPSTNLLHAYKIKGHKVINNSDKQRMNSPQED